LQGRAALKMTTSSSLLHAVEFFAARATAKQNNAPSYRYWSRKSERMVDGETATLFQEMVGMQMFIT